MVSAIAVAGYLVVWLVLRLMALRLSRAALVRRRSPWITRLVLVYCFVFSVGFVIASMLSEWGNWQVISLRLAVGIFIVSLAIAENITCLLSLGPFYSLEMDLKQNHDVTKTGLYRFVRHPIYLGNIVGFLGLCIIMNHWAAWVALPAHIFALFLMARDEESFLTSHLGGEYEEYIADARWMLIPGVL